MGTVHTGGLVQQRSLRGSRRQIFAMGPVKGKGRNTQRNGVWGPCTGEGASLQFNQAMS